MKKRQGLAGSWSVKLLVATAVTALGALMVWGVLAGRNEAAIEAERDRAVKVPIRVSSENGEPLIKLDSETQQRSGIETAALPSAPHPEQVRGYGMVLDVARLTELSNNYANAKAQVQIAQAKLAMSRPAFERAQKLFTEHQVVSEAQLQAAVAGFGTDQASLAAAEAQVRTLTATAYQEWGSVLGKSLIDGSPMITRLIERQDFLLQITLPPAVILPTPPSTASIAIGKASAGSDHVRLAGNADRPEDPRHELLLHRSRGKRCSARHERARLLALRQIHRSCHRASFGDCLVAGSSLGVSAHGSRQLRPR